MVVVTDIVWETDGIDCELPKEVELPKEMTSNIIDLDDLDLDMVTDYLSDTYGWLVESYNVVGVVME